MARRAGWLGRASDFAESRLRLRSVRLSNTKAHYIASPPSLRAAIHSLAEPGAYRTVIALLRERQLRQSALTQDDVELDELSEAGEVALARKLAALVARGEYVFSPVVEREAFLGGKVRRVYRAPLADTIVLFVLARVLTALTGSAVSRHVYSYQKGRSSQQAVRDVAGFVRAHRRNEPRVALRGLHVLRRDVAGYGDRIPVHDASPLWPQLALALERAGCAPNQPFQRLIRTALRPVVAHANGTQQTPNAGIPMGSPLQPAICNLYLGKVDSRLESISDGFYARFGDDMFFAHASAAVARSASECVEQELSALELTLNAEKSHDLFWNGAGRLPNDPLSADERGTTHVEYLGSRLAFDGSIAPSRHKLRRIQTELRARIGASERLLRDVPLADRVQALTGAVRLALDPKSELAVPLAAELVSVCDDRRELAALDRWLVRELAQALTGAPGMRGLRSAPPRFLRQHGLISLVARRARSVTKRDVPPRDDESAP